MQFWIAAAILTLLATLFAVIPLLASRREADDALDHDREVYRARLREIDADRDLGRITAEEAEAAKAEEGRKLIALAGEETASLRPGHGAALRKVALAGVILFLPAMAVLLYWGYGASGRPDMAIAQRMQQDPSTLPVEQLLERAEAQLGRQPDDLRGWLAVAPVYMRMGRLDDAVNAWANALRIEPANVDFMTALAEAMTARNEGVIDKDARKLFEDALASRPKDPKARFYMAIALGQEGRNEEAVSAWEALVGEAPADAPWLEVARAQLDQALERAGRKPAEPAANQPGPTEEDIAAASQMSADDRMSMIENMVAGLAEKLKDNPADRDGWRRLLRSYAVLGRADEARAAFERARLEFAGDAAFISELQAMVPATDTQEPSQ
jgi:cytochrome c-type biogenesis protein CcmH